jgi:hypothetical protein
MRHTRFESLPTAFSESYKLNKNMKSIYEFLKVRKSLCDFYPHVKRWSLKRLWFYTFYVGFRYVAIAVIVSAAFTGFGASWYYVGRISAPIIVKADTKVVTQVQIVVSTTTPPVMQRIQKCESGGTQTKDGQTLININSNGSYDSGLYQINSFWNKEATKLGYDLSKADDNNRFAMYLYENYGTSPWSSSEKCWSK